MERPLVPLVITLVGVSMCAAACFIMLVPYQVYRLARGGWWRLRSHIGRSASAEGGAAPSQARVLMEKRDYS
jgi:hypothetical protein